MSGLAVPASVRPSAASLSTSSSNGRRSKSSVTVRASQDQKAALGNEKRPQGVIGAAKKAWGDGGRAGDAAAGWCGLAAALATAPPAAFAEPVETLTEAAAGVDPAVVGRCRLTSSA